MFKEKQFVFTSSWKISKFYEKSMRKIGTENNLTQCEMDVLLFLKVNSPMNTSRDISNYRSISKSLICKSVASLTKRNLIESCGDGIDARVLRLKLTKEGESLAEKLSEQCDLMCEDLFAGVSNLEIQTLMSVYNRILKNSKEKY